MDDIAMKLVMDSEDMILEQVERGDKSIQRHWQKPFNPANYGDVAQVALLMVVAWTRCAV